MPLGPGDSVAGGEKRDAQGHREILFVDPDAPLLVTDTPSAGVLRDEEGREIIAAAARNWSAADTNVAALQAEIDAAEADIAAINAARGANNGIATLDAAGDVPLAQLGNAPVSIPSVLDHGMSNAGLVDQATAIAALAPGTYFLPQGSYRLATEGIVPAEVNLIGEGPGIDGVGAGSQFVCSTSGGRLTFAAGAGGLSGNFMVDGANVATNPMKLGVCLNRLFVSVKVKRGTGDNLILSGTQNCTFVRLESIRAGAACVALDYGAGSNYFRDSELYYPGTYHIVSRQSGPSPPESFTVDYPINNVFDGGICEYATATSLGAVYHSAGGNLRFTGGINFQIGGAAADSAIFTIQNDATPHTNGNLVIDGINAGAVGVTGGTFLRVRGSLGTYAAIVTGYNYVATFAYGYRYDAGIYSLVNELVEPDFVDVTQEWIHADGGGFEGGYPRDYVVRKPATRVLTLEVIPAANALNNSIFRDSTNVIQVKNNAGGLERVGYTQQAANPDTSGAALADLETEVNQLKAALRAAGILAT